MILQTKVTKSNTGNVYIQWIIALVVNLTTMTFGLQLGWMSPMAEILQSADSPTGRPLTDNEISWIASTFCLSAIIGIPLFVYISDTFGRKIAVMALAVPQGLCWILKLTASNTTTLIIARICFGMASGGVFNVIPIYVKEISQDNIRGLIGSIMGISQNFGLLCMFAMGAYLDYYTVLWIVLGFPLLTIIFMIFAPESPAYLVKTGQDQKALEVLALLRRRQITDEVIEKELSTLKKEDLYFRSMPTVSFLNVLRDKAWRRGFLLMTLMLSFNEGNGCFAITLYAASILKSSGGTINPELQTLSFPVFQTLAGIISLNCVDRFGRKPVLATTLSIIIIAMTTLGSIVMVQDRGGHVPVWVPATLMVLIMASYSGGLSPLCHIMNSEMFNFQIRAKVVGVIMAWAWFIAFLPMIIWKPITNALGVHNTFFIFAGINVLCLLTSVFLLPETRGKTVEEIENALRGKKLKDIEVDAH